MQGGQPLAGGLQPDQAPTWLQKRDREEQQMIDRKQKDSESIVIYMCIMSVLNMFLLAVPMLGGSWNYRSFVGLGLKIMNIKTSLFYITVDIQCGKNFIEDVLCQAGDRVNGVHSLHQAQAMSCAISNSACEVMSRIYAARLIVFLSFSASIVMLGLSAYFLYYYWFIESAPKIRAWGTTLNTMAPFVGMFGMAFWSLYVPDLADLPKGWTASTSILQGYSLFGWHAIQAFPFGWCYIMSAIVYLEMCVFLCIWPWFFRESINEEKWKDEQEKQKDELEAKIMAVDCGMPVQQQLMPGASSSAPPGAAPGMAGGPPPVMAMQSMQPGAIHVQGMGPSMGAMMGQPAMSSGGDFGLR